MFHTAAVADCCHTWNLIPGISTMQIGFINGNVLTNIRFETLVHQPLLVTKLGLVTYNVKERKLDAVRCLTGQIARDSLS